MVKVHRYNLKWSDIDMTNLDLIKLISHFAYSKKAEGKSPKTISWYYEMLLDCVRFLRSMGREAVITELNSATVREFIVHEQDRSLSPYTVQAKVRALKGFASWLCAEGYTDDNLLANVKLPKVPTRIVEPLTLPEIDCLIGGQNPLTSLGCRNIAILVTLLDTGLRLGELCTLLFEDAHIEEAYLKVLGKGSKERVVPIGTLAQKVLWRYVFHFRPEPVGESDNYLFLTLVEVPQPRRFYRLSSKGREAPQAAWSDPLQTMYAYPREFRSRRKATRLARPGSLPRRSRAKG